MGQPCLELQYVVHLALLWWMVISFYAPDLANLVSLLDFNWCIWICFVICLWWTSFFIFFDKYIYSEFKKKRLTHLFLHCFFFYKLEKMKTSWIWTLWIVSTSADLMLIIINTGGCHSNLFHGKEWFKLYYMCES